MHVCMNVKTVSFSRLAVFVAVCQALYEAVPDWSGTQAPGGEADVDQPAQPAAVVFILGL